MIHYAVTLNELIAAINAALGTQARQDSWWGRAHADFRRAIRTKVHDKRKAYWSEVKGAFIALQHDKCAYCELPMPQGSKSRIAYDVEHHRPKSSTSPWPDAKTAQALSISYQVGAGRARGYPELAHHPFNYVAACKVCNSPYKGDFFPILGTAHPSSYLIDELNRREEPAIPLPLGDWGEDPEGFLTFEGFIAMPRHQSGPRRLRAQVVIDFFELNRRADLLLGRAATIALLYQHLKEVAQPDLAADVAEAQSWVDADTHEAAPYAAAARAFKALYDADRPRAVEAVRLANRYISTKSSTLARQLASGLPGQVKSMSQVLAALA